MVRHSWAICCSRADFNGKMSDSRGRDETPRSINSASQRPQNANHKAHYSGDDCWVGPHWEECSGADHSSRRPTRTIIKSKQKDESLLVHYILPKIFLIISPTDVTLELFFFVFFFFSRNPFKVDATMSDLAEYKQIGKCRCRSAPIFPFRFRCSALSPPRRHPTNQFCRNETAPFLSSEFSGKMARRSAIIGHHRTLSSTTPRGDSPENKKKFKKFQMNYILDEFWNFKKQSKTGGHIPVRWRHFIENQPCGSQLKLQIRKKT